MHRQRTLSKGAAIAVVAAALSVAAQAQQWNEPPVKSGFPKEFANSPTGHVHPVGSHVLAADLGLSAGFKSIVFGLRNGQLWVVRNTGGNNWAAAPGWPQMLPNHVYSSPAVGNLDSDPEPEIVVGYGSVETQTTAPGGARAYNRDGTLLWQVTTADVTPGPANGLTDPVMSTPAIGDVDGDGTPEVVFGALDHRLYVVNGADGTSNNPAVWPKDMGDTVFSSPALHNLDGAGGLEIIVGTDAFSINGGRLRVLTGSGSDFPGFAGGKPIDQVVSSSPAVGDIDGDGLPEIVHGTGHFYSNRLERLYAWNCDGTPVAGWPVATDGEVTTSPILVNLDADAQLEVVATTSNFGSSDGRFRVVAFDGTGAPRFSTTVRDFDNQSLSASEPVAGDVFSSSAGTEILVPTNGEVAVFSAAGTQLTDTNGLTGELSDAPSMKTSASLTGVAVTNLETGGGGSPLEVIAVSGRDFPAQTITVIHVWNPNATSTTVVPPWGFFRQDERRTGVAPGTAACGGPANCTPVGTAASFYTLTPCRALDTRASAAPLQSSMPRNFAVGPACGVPSTAKAVAVNVTITQPTSTGFVRFAPGRCTVLPVTSTINFSGGQTRANNAVLPLSTDGSGTIVADAFVLGGGSVHLLIDVTGYFQ